MTPRWREKPEYSKQQDSRGPSEPVWAPWVSGKGYEGEVVREKDEQHITDCKLFLQAKVLHVGMCTVSSREFSHMAFFKVVGNN